MKVTFNKYWILMAIVIIMNIIVFAILSDRLENYVTGVMVDKQLVDNR
jgi:hypothetical protein